MNALISIGAAAVSLCIAAGHTGILIAVLTTGDALTVLVLEALNAVLIETIGLYGALEIAVIVFGALRWNDRFFETSVDPLDVLHTDESLGAIPFVVGITPIDSVGGLDNERACRRKGAQ